MRIEIETGELTEGDAQALLALIRHDFPSLLSSVSTIALTLDPKTGARFVDNRTDVDREFDNPHHGHDDEPLTGDEAEETAREVFAPEAIEEDDEAPLDGAPAAAARPNADLAASLSAEAARTSSPSETDSAGVPWDARIHASTKGKGKTGLWIRKKGLTDEFVEGVLDELAASGAYTPKPKAAPAPAPAVPAAPAPPPVVAPAPPPLPVAAIEAAQTEALAEAEKPKGDEFVTIMRKLTEAQGTGLITAEQIQGFIVEIGLTKIVDLMKNKDLIPQFSAKVNAQIEMNEAVRAAGG